MPPNHRNPLAADGVGLRWIDRHFHDYGLAIAMTDFAGGGESLDALLAGSVDVAVGAYEHTLRAQAIGKDIRAVSSR